MRLRVDRWLTTALAALTALTALTSGARAADPGAPAARVLADDVVAAAGQAPQLGELPHRAYLRLAFTLVARNRPDLDAYVTEAYRPGSPHYRRYLKGSQFADRFGRTTAEIDDLRSFLERNGFHIDDVHSGRLVLDASATAADVERTLGIRLDTWRDAATGRVFYGNATPPRLPADPGSLVADIAGLTDRAVREPTVRLGRAGAGLTPSQLRSAYAASGAAALGRTDPGDQGDQDGALTRVALVEYAGFRPQDVARYDRGFALASPAPELRLVDGGPDLGQAGGGAVAAEIETVQAMAPAAATVVFSAENSAAGEVDAFQGVIDAGIPVAMTGWGAPERQRTESGMRAIDLVMEEGAAEGIGFFSADAEPGRDAPRGTDVDFPACDPYVTAVGTPTSGRGRSTLFTQPWWQARWGRVDPYRRREVPDVTTRLDSAVAVYAAGRWSTATGPGVATALWTALAARFDQRSFLRGEGLLGFAAPSLYRVNRVRG